MKRTVSRLIAVMALSASWSSVAVAQTNSAPAPVDVASVPRPDTDVRAGRITTTVQAPFDSVASVLLDFSRYREFLPQVVESRVIQRRRGQVDVYFRVPLLDNLGQIWSLVRFTIIRTPTSITVSGQQIQGNMRRFEYLVAAEEVPGTARSRVTVQMLALPAIPFPTGMLTGQQTRWGARGMVALRARAEREVGLQSIARGANARAGSASAATQRAPTPPGSNGAQRRAD